MPLRYQKIKLSLYVTHANSGKSLAYLYKALEHHAYNDYELRIVDVDEDPTIAEVLGVKIFPTIQRHTTSGALFYTGDFADADAMREKLGFKKFRE